MTELSQETKNILSTMGSQIKKARVRRNITADELAELAGVNRATISRVEQGNPSVAMGIYANVLHTLNGMDEDLLWIAKDEQLKGVLPDMFTSDRKYASNKKKIV